MLRMCRKDSRSEFASMIMSGKPIERILSLPSASCYRASSLFIQEPVYQLLYY